jgi:hypothetical protein
VGLSADERAQAPWSGHLFEVLTLAAIGRPGYPCIAAPAR